MTDRTILTIFLPMGMGTLGRLLKVVSDGYPGAVVRGDGEVLHVVLPEHAPSDYISHRQVEVLRLAAAGCSNKEIAQALGVSDQTVKNHMSVAIHNLGVHRRGEAVAKAIKLGLFEMPVSEGGSNEKPGTPTDG